MAVPRCPCGAYVRPYAAKIGHVCVSGDAAVAHQPRGRKRQHKRMIAILVRRAEGATLRECADEFGVTYQRICQIIESSGVPVCRKCKSPGELEPGRRICHRCYQTQMNERPSKQSRRSGYRTDPRAHRRAAAIRLAREGRTREEIAGSLGVCYQTVCKWFQAMRKAGRAIEVAQDPYFLRGEAL